MADLRTNYKDDVLDTSVNDKRKYQMIQNSDGTVSFIDVTTYMQNGDTYGSNDVNETNEAVNALNNSLNNENVYKTTPTITNANADSSTTYTADSDCLLTYNLYSYGGAARLVINGITRSTASNGSKTAEASNINSIVLHKGDIVTFTTVGTQGTDYLIQFAIYEK